MNKNIFAVLAIIAVGFGFFSCEQPPDTPTPKADTKAITAFSFTTPAATGIIDETAKTVSVTVPNGTNVTALTPSVTHTGASYSPTGAQNFTNPVTYTVTAEDGTTQDYVVTVTIAASGAKAITAFSFTTPAATGTINETAKTISVTVPNGITVTALTPTITHTGASYSPTGAQDFTNPVTYTVTAADNTTQDYTVTVTVAAADAKAITAFSFTTPAAEGTINETSKTISVTVPNGTNVTALTPSVTHTGASYSPTGAQNFTSPVTYTVKAADDSTQDYAVTVTVAAANAKAISTFSINGVSGTINGTAISVTVPYGTNVTSLTPSITHTGASSSPTGAQNFTNPVTYTVTAEDGTTRDYTVTVSIAAAAAYWTITWDLRGGAWTGTAPANQIQKGATLAQPAAPAKTNCTFVGWYTDTALTSAYTFGTVNSDLTLYAKWNDTRVGDMFGWGEYWPENSTTENGQFTSFNLDHLTRLLNGEVTSSTQWLEADGMVYGEEPNNLGILNKMNGPSVGLPTSATVTGKGYLFMVFAKELTGLSIGGLQQLSTFTKGEIHINNKLYYVYYFCSTSPNTATLNMDFTY